MIRPRNWIVSVLAIGIAAAVHAAPIKAISVPEVRRITALALSEMLKAKDFYLVNVHVPYAGEIAGTDVFIPFDQAEKLFYLYPKDKQAKIVVYCRSGHMSAIAAKELIRMGYTNVLDLDGGMIAWEKAGLTLLRK